LPRLFILLTVTGSTPAPSAAPQPPSLLHLLLPLPLPFAVPLRRHPSLPAPLTIFTVKFIVNFIVEFTGFFPVTVVTQRGGCIVTVQISGVTRNFTVKFLVTLKV
jgi:hypothetical protein